MSRWTPWTFGSSSIGPALVVGLNVVDGRKKAADGNGSMNGSGMGSGPEMKGRDITGRSGGGGDGDF